MPAERLVRGSLLGDLAEVVGVGNLIVDRAALGPYETDITGKFRGAARAALRPQSAAECGAALEICARAGASVVVQGGNTGLAGGATPVGGEIVLLTERLLGIEIDEAEGVALAGAGTVLEDLQAELGERGLMFAVDLGARSKATLGGMAATNAGGQLALRLGTMSRQVLGAEAVLPTGGVFSRLRPLRKDTAGYNLTQLLVGSEGTLAVLTRLLLRILPSATRMFTALLGFRSAGEALHCARLLEERVEAVRCIELMLEDGMQAVCEHRELTPPFQPLPPVALLVELTDDESSAELLAGALEAAGHDGPSAVAVDFASRRKLWELREGHNETIGAMGASQKFDVALPRRALSGFVESLESGLVAEAGGGEAAVYVYGHAGDGNLHVSVVGAPAERQGPVEDAVLAAVLDAGGTISAEHGIGIAKRRALAEMREAADLDAMRAIRAALDPAGILGNGSVLGAPEGV
ncbi:MAG: FAD-binding oxidoreductase [Thermoleophilia bacterium]|nr:FAD-binding oxidoreductase [Thermoleophilia bacterium]